MQDDPLANTLVETAPPAPVAVDTRDLHASLAVLAGDSEGALHELTGTAVVIGRSPEVDIVLSQAGISRGHARVLRGPGGYVIEDLGSTNGTFVEGNRIHDMTPLRDRDRIQIGGVVLRFSLQDRMSHEAERRRYEMSVRDGLTELYNRRHFDQQLAGEFSFALRHSTSLTAIALDVDHFKRVNDTWGHPAGDAVLRQIAATLSGVLRAEDLLARYGGEEFAVLARGIAVSGARALAERLRVGVQNLDLRWDGQRIPVTISLGIAHTALDLAIATPEALMSCADEALYAAKRGGRNRARLAGDEGEGARRGFARPDARNDATAPVYGSVVPPGRD